MTTFALLPRPLVLAGFVLAVLGSTLPAAAQQYMSADANALGSYASVVDGVLTTVIGAGGGATAGPTGPGVTTAVADAFQTSTIGNPPQAARNDAHSDADLRTGIVRASIINTAVPGSGTTGDAAGRMGDHLYFTNTSAAPIVLPLSWTVDGELTINTSSISYSSLATFYFTSVGGGIPSPVLRGTNQVSHALYFLNINGTTTFYDQLSGQVFPFGTTPAWTITRVGNYGARMDGALIIPPGQSEMNFYLRVAVDCRSGTSCDFASGNRGGAFRFGTFPAALSMRSQSGVFLGIVPPPPPTSPGAPQNFQATASGNTVDMSWSAPTSGSAPTSYTLVAKTPSGAPLGTLPLGLVTNFSAAAPNGAYLLSVLAANAVGTGPESNTVTVSLPSALQPPGPPSGLTASVAGSTVGFTWNAPSSGGAVANYVLVVGGTPGFTTPLAAVPLPASPRSVSFSGIPPGTYYLRMVAQNAAGTSAASPEIAMAVAGATAPGAPTLNAPVVTGNTVALSWTPGVGGAPTSYMLSVTGAAVGTAPLSGTSLTVPGVPSGTYFLRLVALNSAGPSPSSAQVTLVVP